MRSFLLRLTAMIIGWQVLYFGWFLVATTIAAYLGDVGDGGCVAGAGC